MGLSMQWHQPHLCEARSLKYEPLKVHISPDIICIKII